MSLRFSCITAILVLLNVLDLSRSECCYPTLFRTNCDHTGLKLVQTVLQPLGTCLVNVCGNGESAVDGACGVGSCNFFRCNCDGGCIPGDPRAELVRRHNVTFIKQ